MKDIWDKSKDGNRKEQRSLARVAIVAAAIAVVFLFVKKDNVIRWIQGGFTIARQNKEIKANDKKIRELDQKIESLTSNKDSLEKFARENWNFAEHGDDIYIIPEK
ncbi:MAG: septum formation initiator family protein [Bacteroidales bacterium]|nr:septum formation initiator family protein [Bacteroidales bacterium]